MVNAYETFLIRRASGGLVRTMKVERRRFARQRFTRCRCCTCTGICACCEWRSKSA